jgi:hypothetical protein
MFFNRVADEFRLRYQQFWPYFWHEWQESLVPGCHICCFSCWQSLLGAVRHCQRIPKWICECSIHTYVTILKHRSSILISLRLLCYSASSPPLTVHEICSHNNEHFEEISRRGAQTCSPREAKRDGTPTNKRFFTQQCDIGRVVKRNCLRDWTWIFKPGVEMIRQTCSFLLKTDPSSWGCKWLELW